MPVTRTTAANNAANNQAAASQPNNQSSSDSPKSSFSDKFHASFTGRLGANPELRAIKNGGMLCSFSVGCARGEDTEWRRCVAFRQLGEYISSNFKKGDKVLVLCSDQKTKSRTDEAGNPLTSIDWVVEGMSPLYYGKGNYTQPQAAAAEQPIGDPETPLA